MQLRTWGEYFLSLVYSPVDCDDLPDVAPHLGARETRWDENGVRFRAMRENYFNSLQQQQQQEPEQEHEQ